MFSSAAIAIEECSDRTRIPKLESREKLVKKCVCDSLEALQKTHVKKKKITQKLILVVNIFVIFILEY